MICFKRIKCAPCASCSKLRNQRNMSDTISFRKSGNSLASFAPQSGSPQNVPVLWGIFAHSKSFRFIKIYTYFVYLKVCVPQCAFTQITRDNTQIYRVRHTRCDSRRKISSSAAVLILLSRAAGTRVVSADLIPVAYHSLFCRGNLLA